MITVGGCPRASSSFSDLPSGRVSLTATPDPDAVPRGRRVLSARRVVELDPGARVEGAALSARAVSERLLAALGR